MYVHVPFCRKRCPYCAFVLIESDGSLHERFVERLCREIHAAKYGEVATLFFGGGTPSLLTPSQIGRIVRTVGGSPTEVTLEANPETPLDVRGYRAAGINRLSLGVQALDDRELRDLGREHTVAEAERTYAEAREGFENISIDIIFGLPGQDFGRTLTRLLEWDPPHISLYGLTYEPGTDFTRTRTPIAQEAEAEMYTLAIDRITAAGYRHYELSNFAKPGFESAHNIGYWEGRPYLGFGPGAHSYVPPRRWANLSNVRMYLESEDPVMTVEELTEPQRMLERVFLGLRQEQGVDLLAFQEEFGVGLLTRFRPQVAELQALGVVEIADGRFRLTRKGKLVADDVIGKFA